MRSSLETLGTFYKIPYHPSGGTWTVLEAYEFCKDLTVSHYENFPVGSILIPKSLRPHVFAIYAYARVADDFADEQLYENRRLDLLNDWNRQLIDCYEGKAEHPIFIALSKTVAECDLPIELFQGLLHAFKMDVTVKRYNSYEDVLGYCRFSANPVGRLILHLFNYRDEKLFSCSDHICTALQLTNFWQDITIDLKKDRIYIPLKDMKHEGYTVEDLYAHVYNERFKRVMQLQTSRTWKLFDEGYPLLDQVKWPLSSELRFTWLGGTRILKRTVQNDYNVFDQRPKLSKLDFVHLGLRSLWQIKRYRRNLELLFPSK